MSRLKNIYPIERMSELFGVSKSGYYRFLRREEGKRACEDLKLKEEIKSIFREHKKNYGSPRVYEELRARGVRCGENRVARLMRISGLKAKTSKKRKKFKLKVKDKQANLLNRDFMSDRRDTKWVSDITYIKTIQGWVYLCAIIDLFSRKVVGHYMAVHMRGELVVKAVKQAVRRRSPKAGLIFHSDLGVQYGCNDLINYMKDLEIRRSMSAKGSCYDNAAMESFFSSLKRECVGNQVYESLEHAQNEIFKYIESYYNNYRRHSTLGYLSPVQFEKKYGSSLC